MITVAGMTRKLCSFFRQKLATALLDQRNGENDCRKYFMINLHGRMLPNWQGLNQQSPEHIMKTCPY